ncbi:hypothetical protein FDO65_09970 [Nakamurella flava]|uniref:Uncharacterized protein n=1 Tax=Nakamurella flava TaxID=2576308 RepID=A0A4U6QMM2_9ACTN|nr:hypothetical protein [Nakamurella flava]TKV61843.1 hypothetical protein FDO65_09970 [Nakamurella flava]
MTAGVGVPFGVYRLCRALPALRRVPSHDEHFIDRAAREVAVRTGERRLAAEVAAWRAEDPAGFEAVMADLRLRDLLERTAAVVVPDAVRRPWPIRPQVSIAKEPEDFGPFEIEEDL